MSASFLIVIRTPNCLPTCYLCRCKCVVAFALFLLLVFLLSLLFAMVVLFKQDVTTHRVFIETHILFILSIFLLENILWVNSSKVYNILLHS